MATLFAYPVGVIPPVDSPDRRGTTQSATAEPISQAGVEGITGYDPWTHANLALMADKSQPEITPYGEPAYALAGEITSEWGGMPSLVRYFVDIAGAVLAVKRPVKDFYGPTGRFYGPEQTAYEVQLESPTTDYWSVIIGQD